MDIFDLLKQLKNEIKPDKDFVLYSRRKLMVDLSNQSFFLQKRTRSIFWQMIYSISFTAAIFVFIVGIFSMFKFITPKLGVLNPETIKAEADAIDFQIKISKLIYNTPEKSNVVLKILNNNEKLNTTSSNNNDIENISDLISENKNNLNNLGEASQTQTNINDILDYLSK